jgi:hypothetical protein
MKVRIAPYGRRGYVGASPGVVVRPNEFQRPTPNGPEFGGGQGGGGSDMNGDRLTRIEWRLATIETEQRGHLRWTMLIAIGLASLFAVGFGIMMVRIDRAEDKISRVETSVLELPGKISQNLMQLNQTLLQAITATNNQKSPQIIVIANDSTSEPSTGKISPIRRPLTAPKLPAHQRYHQSPKGAWSHSLPSPEWSAASYGCERNCSTSQTAQPPHLTANG